EMVGVIVVTVLARAAVLAWFLHGYVHVRPLADNLAGDLKGWFYFVFDAQHGRMPYVDLRREYPPGATLLYLLIGLTWDIKVSMWQAMAWHGAFMTLVDAVNALLFLSLVREVDPRR